MYGGHHPGRGRAKRACSVDLLAPGILVRGTVGAGPEAVRGAGGVTVHVASEDDGAGRRTASKDRSELGALQLVRGHLNGLVPGKVSSAYVNADPGAGAQPHATLRAGLRLERLAGGAQDGCFRQHRVTEESTTARSYAGQRLAVVDHLRETQVVAGPLGDQRDVTAARLVECDRV